MAPLYYLARTCTTLGSTCQDGEPKSDVVKAVTAPLMKLVIRAETTTDIQDAYTYIGN